MLRHPFVAIAILPIALQSAAAPATQRSATRPATATATTSPTDPEDERIAELDAVFAAAIPQDVRDGKKEPTDEQKLMMTTLLFVQLGASKSPERLQESESNRQKGRDKLAAVEQLAAEVRKENANKSAAMRDAAAKGADAQVRAIKLFNELTDAPATRDASDQQVEEKLYDRLRRFPQLVREMIVAQTDAKYYAQRLELLDKLDAVRRQAATQPSGSPSRRQTDQQTAAHEALLKALDAKHEAQQQLLKITPLGQLNNAMID